MDSTRQLFNYSIGAEWNDDDATTQRTLAQVLSFLPSREFDVPFRQLQVKLSCVKFPSLII